MEIAKWISPIFAIVVWAVIFILIKPRRIKELLPIGLIAALILFTTDEILISLRAIKFNQPLLPIAGQPLFHLVWGAGGGILLINYLKEEFSKKLPIILFFGIATVFFEYVAETAGSYTTVREFTFTHDFLIDIFSLAFLVWVSEGLFGDLIYRRKVGS